MRNWEKSNTKDKTNVGKKSNRMNEKGIEREGNNGNLEKEKPKGHKRNASDKKNKNNDINCQIEKPKTVNILGDSMVKKLNGYLRTMKWNLSKFEHFQGLKSIVWLIKLKKQYEMTNQTLYAKTSGSRHSRINQVKLFKGCLPQIF